MSDFVSIIHLLHVRISVPHNSLNVPYRIKSTHRKSVNTLDSMGISKVCCCLFIEITLQNNDMQAREN